MVAYSENPFASVGNSFGGDHFIGRSEALETIANRVIRPEQQRGSLAIIGLPQTGKTWLIARAFIEPEARQELLRRRLLPIQIKLTAYGNPLHFFYDLVACCKEEL
ncbi:MAG: ATP-binding protein, partial [Thermogemmatispora sp.]